MMNQHEENAIGGYQVTAEPLPTFRGRKADFMIGDPLRPYLLRWWIIPRNRFFNIYLHQIRRSDDDRALHDHPWFNISVILKGGYYEVMPDDWNPLGAVAWRARGHIISRRATAKHRLVLARDDYTLEEYPCWSLFITGPKIREWGFWCPQGFKHWRKFIGIPEGQDARGDEVGPGCND